MDRTGCAGQDAAVHSTRETARNCGKPGLWLHFPVLQTARPGRLESSSEVLPVSRIWLAGLLPLLLAACHAPGGSSDGVASKAWQDLPVPKGFRPVRDPELAVPVNAGATYRAGELLFEGRGTAAGIQEYYRERMPLFGWEWEPDGGFWRKGATQARIVITQAAEGASANLPLRIRYRIRLRSQRPPLNSPQR